MTQFIHQKVAQQSVQSVCRDCLTIVATASHRVQLEGPERAHICPQELKEGYFVDWQQPKAA